MKALFFAGAIIALCSVLIPDIHQGLKQRAFSNPSHSAFDHETKNYMPIENLIVKKHSSIDGPETVVVAENGDIYAGVKHGLVVRINAIGEITPIATVPGRAIGLALNNKEDGRNSALSRSHTLSIMLNIFLGLYVCVAAVGLVFVDLTTRNVIILTTVSDDGIPIRFADDVAVARDGKVYFSDASRISPWIDEHGESNPMLASLMDATLGSGTGRLLVYDPADKSTMTLMGDLLFANGVAMGPDDSFVLVCETFGFRITRFWLSGYRKDTIDYLVTTLPGFPDNIRQASDGGYWVAINAEVRVIILSVL
jgi:sugar lactone lactonase YvrE